MFLCDMILKASRIEGIRKENFVLVNAKENRWFHPVSWIYWPERISAEHHYVRNFLELTRNRNYGMLELSHGLGCSAFFEVQICLFKNHPQVGEFWDFERKKNMFLQSARFTQTPSVP
jgi:hypothetical protein